MTNRHFAVRDGEPRSQVAQASEELVEEPNHSYVSPPGKDISLVDGPLGPCR